MIKLITLNGLEHWNDIAKENVGNKVFIRNSSVISLSHIRVYKPPDHDYSILWQIDSPQDRIGYKSFFYIGDLRCTQEEFVSHISKEYPEYMEWFLFNSEWLH